ncbi:MAG: Calx-beta domain-containing protein [Planctomycetaceae bacterium]
MAAIVGNEAFIRGNYVEVGVHAAGSFGTFGSAPEGFHPYVFTPGTGNLGFVADFEKDGWDTSSNPGVIPNQTGDFFVPGSPEESFTIEWGNGVDEHTFTNAGLNGEFDIPQTSVTDVGNAEIDAAVWAGTATAGAEVLDVTQTVSVGADNLYFIVSVTLTNRSATTLLDLEYMRSVDPDQEQPITGNFTTSNAVLDVGPDQVLITATGLDYGMMGGFGANVASADRVVVSNEGFLNRDPDLILDSPNQPTPGDPDVSDSAMAIAFEFDELAPGQSVTFNFAVILDATDLDRALGDISTVEIVQPTGTVSGNAVSFQATTSDVANTSQIEFFVDGVSVGVDTTADLGGIFETTFDSFPFADGPLSIRAEARFDDGSTASRTETVIVRNSGPEISFVTPTPGQAFPIGAVGIPVDISVDNPANPPVVVNFFRETVSGSVALGSDNTAPFGTSFGVNDLAPGSNVTIKAVAVDAAGRLTTITVGGAVADLPPDVAFQVDAGSVNEDAGSIPVVVTRSGNLDTPSQVQVTLASGGTATPDADFDATGTFPLVIDFAVGQGSATFDIPIIDDTADEPDEVFSLDLAAVSNAVVALPSTFTVTILDNDANPVC